MSEATLKELADRPAGVDQMTRALELCGRSERLEREPERIPQQQAHSRSNGRIHE